tara:strand:- start:37 stop:426 length:390 start_codon:yes stop_codon:yes gene_type:complete
MKKIMSPGALKIFLCLLFFSTSLIGEPISGNFATLKLLDKTTNKVSKKIIDVNTAIDWDTLNIKVYGCYSTPPEEVPEDYVLIEVIDMLTVNKEYVYRGWMISSSPDITPLEHPIYDLWLVDCKIDKTS